MRRLSFLDSLRGLAAVYVVFYHMTLLPDPHLALPHWASAVVLTGGTGVSLFFIASAFSLCYTAQLHGNESPYIFYVRRFFRIAPLFYSCIIFYMIRDYFYYHSIHSFKEVAASALFVFNFLPGHEAGFVWASWTIGVEMVFYLTFPFLFHRLRTISSLTAAFFAALLATVVFHEILLHTSFSTAIQESYFSLSFPRVLPIFLFGMLTYRIYERTTATTHHPISVGYALILGSFYAYNALLQGNLVFWFTDAYYWQPVIYATLLLGLSIHPTAVLVNRVTEYLGKISYSIYLLHPSTVLFLYPVYKRIYTLPMPVSAQFLLSAAVTMGIVVVIAALTYRYIERPGINLGKKVLQRIGSTSEIQEPIPVLTAPVKD